MNLTRKVLLIIGIILAALIFILYFAAQTILLDGYKDLENTQVTRNVNRVENQISDELIRIGSTNRDYAHWTDTADFIRGENETYPEDNLSIESITNLNINLMLFLNTEQEVVYTRFIDLDQGEELPLPDEVLNIIRAYPSLVQHTEEQSAIRGIISTPLYPMLITSYPVLNNESRGPIQGTLILGRFLDETEVQMLQESVRLTFNIFDYSAEAMPVPVQNAKNDLNSEGQVVVTAHSNDDASGYSYLSDLNGDPALLLEVNTAREVMAKGRDSVSFFILSLISLGVVAGGAILFVLQRFVLSRVGKLSNDVAAIGGDFSRRITLDGDDELGMLAQKMSAMLADLEKSHERLAESTRRTETIIKSAPVVLWSVDNKRNFTFLDGKALESLNVNPVGLLGKPVTEAPTVPLLEKDIERAFLGETVVNLIKVYDQTFDMWYTPIRDENGKITSVIGVAANISERQKAEQALLEAYNTLEKQNRALERVQELVKSTFQNLHEAVTRGADIGEVREYLKFASQEFDKLDLVQ